MKTSSKERGVHSPAAVQQTQMWFWASLVGFCLCFLGTAGLIFMAPRLALYGLTGNIFYLVVIPAGLCAAAFLFGALHSSAKYRGKAFNGTLELGGPVVVFCLVVLGAFLLPKAETTFSLIVRVSGPAGPSDVIKAGTVTVDFGTDRRTKEIGPTGEAYFNEVPTRFVGSSAKIFATVPDYQMRDNASRTIPDSHIVYLELVPAPQKPVALRGLVVNPAGEPLSGVRLSVVGSSVTAQTDASGSFSLTVPPQEIAGSFRLRAEKGGHIGFDNYIVPPGPLTITFKEAK